MKAFVESFIIFGLIGASLAFVTLVLSFLLIGDGRTEGLFIVFMVMPILVMVQGASHCTKRALLGMSVGAGLGTSLGIWIALVLIQDSVLFSGLTRGSFGVAVAIGAVMALGMYWLGRVADKTARILNQRAERIRSLEAQDRRRSRRKARKK